MKKNEKLFLPKTPSFRLDGQIALVSGAGRGLGVALSATLAEAGAHVLLLSRTTREIEALADAIREAGGSADALSLDVTDIESVRRELATRPPIDVLVNNAGTNRPKPLMEVSEEDYDAVADINLKAVFFLTQLVVRRLLAERRPGSIINMSSQMGHVGAADRALYCSTKHGIEGFTKALAVELAPHGIRVNAIAPTFIETPMTKPYFANRDFRAEVLRNIKLGRIGVPDDVMGAALFLASRASSLVTGSSLRVDGGWTAA